MRLLVTGASSYVGSGILRRAPHDWNIAATYFAHPIEQATVAARKRSPLAQESSRQSHERRMLAPFCVDVRDTDAVNRLFAHVLPDVVIHTPALMSGDALMTTNVDGVRNVARAATRHNARLIHISSDVIFDGEHAPYDESASPAPITPYGESKARAEQAVHAEHPSPIIVRTSLVYGFESMDPRTRQMLAGKMPFLFTDEYRCPIFVDDLADALIEIVHLSFRAEREISQSTTEDYFVANNAPRNDNANVINIAGPQRLSRYEFGIKLAKAFHVTPKFEPATSASFPTPRPRDCTLDISLAQRILKTKLRSVDEVLQSN